MFDIEFEGPNRWLTHIDGQPYVFLWRPHIYYSAETGLVEIYMACSVYDHPLKSGDTPVKLFHVKPGGQILGHEEGGVMEGGPVAAVFADDIIDFLNE